jgi:hypothetical protein
MIGSYGGRDWMPITTVGYFSSPRLQWSNLCLLYIYNQLVLLITGAWSLQLTLFWHLDRWCVTRAEYGCPLVWCDGSLVIESFKVNDYSLIWELRTTGSPSVIGSFASWTIYRTPRLVNDGAHTFPASEPQTRTDEKESPREWGGRCPWVTRVDPSLAWAMRLVKWIVWTSVLFERSWVSKLSWANLSLRAFARLGNETREMNESFERLCERVFYWSEQELPSWLHWTGGTHQ